MVDSSDQRDFKRMALDCAMVYRHKDSDGDHAATARNISSTGLLFVCNERLNEGDRLHVNVTPDMAVVPPLDAQVQVLRVTEGEQEGEYQIACVIQEFMN